LKEPFCIGPLRWREIDQQELLMKCIALKAVSLGLFLVLAGTPSSRAQSPQSENEKGTNSGSQSDPAGSTRPHDEKFIIGNDDVLAISVWNEPNMTKSVPVRSDGKISLPLVGEIQAAGRTPMQLELDITEKLKNFITAPQVNVIVQQVNSRKFNVLGEVGRPGSYALTTSTTVMDAIALAGGFRDFAKKSNVYVLRKSRDGSESKLKFNYKEFIKGKNSDQNVKLEPNDTVIVP
jgi:polysaccharide biosynthesis/export protein